MLPIKDIYVTQAGLRDPGQLGRMVRFVQDNGIFDEVSMKAFRDNNPKAHLGPVIQIARFEDGRLFVADGHHRMVAMVKAGRDYLNDSEYTILDWKYQDYLDIHFGQKWVTPFDPRTHVRYPDYFDFKKNVYEKLRSSETLARLYILSNIHLYAQERNMTDIPDMTEKMF